MTSSLVSFQNHTNQQKNSLITLSSLKISQEKIQKFKNGQQMFEFAKAVLKKYSSMQLDHVPSEVLKIVESCSETYYCPRGVIFQESYPENGQLKFQRIQSIQSICHIDFPNLRFLILSSNNLSSIEALSFLNAPRLEKLGLQGNQITNLNSISKSHFPNLWSIIFYGNPITQIEKFDRSVSNKISYFKMDDSEVTNNNRLEDYRFLFKKLSYPPKYIGIEDEKRISIKGKGFYKMLQKQGTYIASYDDKIYLA